jgi:pheromone shutdown protein TraB
MSSAAERVVEAADHVRDLLVNVTAGEAEGVMPLKKKQKRNKPTLSCLECVERKTKVSAAINHQKSQNMSLI